MSASTGADVDDADLDIVQMAADALSPALRAARDAFFATTFRGGNDPARFWASPHDHYFLLNHGAMIGHVGVYRRAIIHAGQRFAVAGIAKVGVIADARGGGRGSRLMRHVQGDLRGRATDDLGLLVTGENRFGFYGRLGWERVAGPVTYNHMHDSMHAGTPRIETFPVLLLNLCLDDAAHHAWLHAPVDLSGPLW